MTLPLHTFQFEGSEYLRYPPDPWVSPRQIPEVWFAQNVHEFLYSQECIIKESLPYKVNEGPWAAGIYFLIHNDSIVYVGKSVEIMRRLNQHREKGWVFNQYWCFGGIPELYIEHVEAFYIYALAPPLNEKYPILHKVIEPIVRLARDGLLPYAD